MIDRAKEAGVEQFVFFSVLHPQIDALVHHRQKLLVEQYLIDSGLPYTILQPAHFMQMTNVLAVSSNGVLPVPYSIDAPMSYVDLRDVGETAAKLLSEEGHLRATYELVGPDCMGYRTVAELISRESGKPVEAKQIPIAAFLEHLPPCADRDYAIDMFERMFTYYNRHGLTGNSIVLSYLLGRPATSYGEYIRHELSA
jgi:uncharacterized protein YbjT (DUF2867 family)